MYHIEKDKRSETSAKLIYDGFLKCIKNNEFTKITITQIHQEAGVGRTTFYRLFDEPIDILVHQCDLVFDEIIENRGKAENGIYYFISYWLKHGELLEAIVKCNRIDILFNVHIKNTERIQKMLSIDYQLTNNQMNYLMSLLTSILIGNIFSWITNGKKEGIVEMYENMVECQKAISDILGVNIA